jgi:hypothetical protein
LPIVIADLFQACDWQLTAVVQFYLTSSTDRLMTWFEDFVNQPERAELHSAVLKWLKTGRSEALRLLKCSPERLNPESWTPPVEAERENTASRDQQDLSISS